MVVVFYLSPAVLTVNPSLKDGLIKFGNAD
jgi:hypothetical protein